SAASDLHLAVVREEKDRPAVLLGQFLRLQQARAPSNFIETSFLGGWLPFLYPLIDEGPHVSNGDRRGIVATAGCDEDQTAHQQQGEESSAMAHGRLLA